MAKAKDCIDLRDMGEVFRVAETQPYSLHFKHHNYCNKCTIMSQGQRD